MWFATTMASSVAWSTIPSCACGMPAWKTATACALIGPNCPSETVATVIWIARMAFELKRLAATTAARSCAGVSGPGARARTRWPTDRWSSAASPSSATTLRASTLAPEAGGARFASGVAGARSGALDAGSRETRVGSA